MKTQLEFFKNAINKNRLSHLYLLSGSSGTGKLDLAYEVSNMLLESHDHSANRLANIKSNNHGQVYYIKPDGNVIKKEQILALQEEFSKTSLVKAPRIYIIDQVDLISTSAANSLLKFMEEPDNASVYGLLISNNVSNVLDTIISRSQVIRFESSDNRAIYEYLMGNDADDYNAYLISHLTNSKIEALEYLNDNQFLTISNYIKFFIENYPLSSFNATLSLNQELTNMLYDRKYYLVFLELMLVNFVEVMKYLSKEKISNEFLNEVITKNYKNFDIKQIIQATKFIQEEISKLSTYINLSLSLEVLMLNIKKR